ncbi:MAG: TIGR00730 family Rossman fold protein [Hyphomicrobiaceae bacterium]
MTETRRAAETSKRRNVCVYCGSGTGRNTKYAQAARTLGRDLARAGFGLVYGGGVLGLMGEVAHAARDAGGYVTGIMPSFLSDRERLAQDIDETIVVQNMHQRKMLMFEHSVAFVALPGGIGTLEELVEQLTWAQLGQHRRPIVLANVADFWSPFLALLEHMRSETFIRKELDVDYTVIDNAADIVSVISEQLRTTGEEKERDATITAQF